MVKYCNMESLAENWPRRQNKRQKVKDRVLALAEKMLEEGEGLYTRKTLNSLDLLRRLFDSLVA